MSKSRRSNVVGTIYLLHFEKAYKHARHYLGWTEGDLCQRIDDHMLGRGSRLVDVITEEGIAFVVAATWVGTRRDERKLKNAGHSPRICPLCKGEKFETQKGE